MDKVLNNLHLRSHFDDDRDADTFLLRLERYSPEILSSLEAVYSTESGKLLDKLVTQMILAFHARPADLKRLDEARLLKPDWLQASETIGYVAYTERFGGNLKEVGRKVDYLKDLGVTYLHLMPLLKPREGENDGGYAVADYRSVRPDLGTIDDLSALARELRQQGISLVLDLVINHVAQEHEWATKARLGDPHYRNYFHILPDKSAADAYEKTLPEVFPDFAPGNFTWNDQVKGYVWTTFNSYQWDLNWSNPNVLCEFLEIIFYLANRGVEVFRLDAIAFIYKRLGTNCQNQPEVHNITQVLRACLRIVAPAVAFKAEAIVAPSELIHYLGSREHYGKLSDLAYHNSLMVQLWSSLASRNTRLMQEALQRFPPKPSGTTWGVYVRCHDDIGWAIDDSHAQNVQLDGFLHRKFLSDFYAGEFEGSFARGKVFQFNPATGDRRISGTAASLAGLESALESGDKGLIQNALDRILMLHTVILGFGGVPLLYMGDEIATLNDYAYATDPRQASDNRWMHRPFISDTNMQNLSTEASYLNTKLRKTIAVRKNTPHFHASIESKVIPYQDSRLLILERSHPIGVMIQVYNFSEDLISLPISMLKIKLGSKFIDLISQEEYSYDTEILEVKPYQSYWLIRC